MTTGPDPSPATSTGSPDTLTPTPAGAGTPTAGIPASVRNGAPPPAAMTPRQSTTTPAAAGKPSAGQPAALANSAPPPAAPTTAAAAAAAQATTVVKVSGVGCANDATQNWYASGMDGSWSEKSGGASGCGRFVAMPMSGSSSWDSGRYVVWWFETSPVVTGSCAVAVYIPSSGVANDVAGRPSYYKVLGGRTSSSVYAGFSVDQTVNRGRWVGVGTYPLRNGAISIHLANRGANPNGERHGAAQVRVSCTNS
ncbi:hypothetical protein O7632_13255 [Solwaraspora sp. WMMD406]|uniref:hypothetical protein n=1 Tax=Solwaraspora sp. WMMD406 TaxID=3016095 RepID=UPI0024176DD2|nr:hypothetical protein [Solwaraspora sp. WMMD406]MDG4765058.1 hypothetical protein [Solwaraspora sp. WMMD406]